ncbi:DUF2218 domain-containing protein [Novosphingobium sp. 1949]|uniref:DUF2218 domain-containing protein n=1 Tax=Novosphingobium organovorum TaxID=2930092 RepID=A0ABT0B7Y1_9SPHN|nr:DUF2218 domain-containing protein [Novosphingobium organovorum]MCJ2181166.1 DUF2218 domain-containing protein [Novosphingobium organovorum]
MSALTATVATPNAGKYMRQLCKHWSHKLDTKVEGDVGTVTFPSATAVLAAGPEAIVITISGEDRAAVEPLGDVVARHIDRFAFREAPLTYRWEWVEPAA